MKERLGKGPLPIKTRTFWASKGQVQWGRPHDQKWGVAGLDKSYPSRGRRAVEHWLLRRSDSLCLRERKLVWMS